MTQLRCGKNGYVVLDNATIDMVYNCGQIEGYDYPNASLIGSRYKSGARHNKASLLSLILTVVLFAIGTSAVEFYHEYEPGVFNFSSPVTQLITGQSYLTNNNTYVTNVRLGNSTNHKRDYEDNVSCTESFCIYDNIHTQNYGTWWTSWEKSSGCFYQGLGSGGSESMQYSHTLSWSLSVGAGISWGAVSATSVFTISESYTVANTWTCTVNAGDSLSIWTQSKMYWADVQKQTCYNYPNGDTTCGSFSQYYRANAPISDGHQDNLNVGCSTGSASGC